MTEDIPLLGGRAEPEEQVGRGEVEEMQHMALHHLSVMHQAAHLLRRGRDRVGADDHVHRLGSGEVVAHRADAAKTLHDHRNFPQEPAPDEPFEPAKLNDMQPCFVDLRRRRSRWIVTLPWPSTRVTGEISISLGFGHPTP
jgi:hypothetical protein